MNAIAAAPGWRNLAIWAMPPIAYALASDTLIAVVRAWALARHQHLTAALAADEATPLAILGGLILWLLRLALAPASTLAGFRAWVLEECPVAPGRRAARPAPPPAGPAGPGEATVPRKATKTARFLSLVTERHGPLASIPLDRVAADQRRPGPSSRPEPRRRPRRPAQSRPRRPERRPPMIAQVRHRPGHPDRPGRRRSPGRSCPPGTCPATAPGTCASGCTCGCTPARASPTSSACGCAGAAWPRCAAPAGSAPRSRCGTGSPTRASTRCSSAGPTTGTACASRWKSTCWSWPRPGPTRPRSWPMSSCATPARSSPPAPKPTSTRLTSAVRAQLGPVHVFNPQHIGGVAVHLLLVPGRRAARTRPPRSAAPTRSRSPCRRRASRTARSGPPRPRTTCAATSTPPPWPGTTCARWPPGCPAPTRTSPSGSCSPPAPASGR